jgi:hypothetical protein
MEYVVLQNPEDGADIRSNFVSREDEKKEYDEQKKIKVVTNAKEIVFPKNSQIKTDRKTADYILQTWGFIKEVGAESAPESAEKSSEVSEQPTEPKVAENATSEPTEATEDRMPTPEEEFEELSAIGWPKLSKWQRDRYKKLREQLKK